MVFILGLKDMYCGIVYHLGGNWDFIISSKPGDDIIMSLLAVSSPGNWGSSGRDSTSIRAGARGFICLRVRFGVLRWKEPV